MTLGNVTLWSYVLYSHLDTFFTRNFQKISSTSQTQIQNKIRPILNSLGKPFINVDIFEVHSPLPPTFYYASFFSRYVGIGVWKELPEIDEKACAFAIKHECGHIYHRDWKNNAIKLLIDSSTLLFFKHYLRMSFIPTGISFYLIDILSSFLLYSHPEYIADQFAINNSTPEELKGGVRLIKAFQKIEKDISSHYPPSELRISMISQALNEKEIFYQPTEKEIAPLVKIFKEKLLNL